MKIIFILLFLVSCGKESSNNDFEKIYRIDAELQEYVYRFQDQGSDLGKPIKVDYLIAEFKDLKDIGKDKIGVCYYPDGGKGTPIIQIDPEYWATGVKNVPPGTPNYSDNPKMLDAAREYVMFHELGHCILAMAHRDGPKGADSRYPTSVMNTYALSPEFYLGLSTIKTPSPECTVENNYNCLVTELFFPNTYNSDSITMAGLNSEDPVEKDDAIDEVITYKQEDIATITTVN